MNYPASTQSKNRSPDVLPGKDSPALPRKYFNFIFVCLFVFFFYHLLGGDKPIDIY